MVGDKGSTAFEVIDLATREVVFTTQGSFIGWLFGDSYLIAGEASWGALSLRPTLVSRAGDRLNALQFLTIRSYLTLVFATLVVLLAGLALWQ